MPQKVLDRGSIVRDGRVVGISDKWSGKLLRNRLVGHVPQKDLANNVMDQNLT